MPPIWISLRNLCRTRQDTAGALWRRPYYLLSAGLQAEEVDRIYRSLFVYSIGFFQLIRKILEHTRQKYTIVTGLWKVYAILLEYCCQFDYEMIITTLNLEKREELDHMEKDFKEQIAKNEESQRQMLDSINLSETAAAAGAEGPDGRDQETRGVGGRAAAAWFRPRGRSDNATAVREQVEPDVCETQGPGVQVGLDG